VRLYAYVDRRGLRRFGVVTPAGLLTGGALERRGGLPRGDSYLPLEAHLEFDPTWQRTFRRAAARARKRGARPIPIAARRPAAPFAYPRKVIGVGLNYAEHVTEGGRTVAPANTVLFGMFANAVVADGEPVVRPEGTTKMDLEVELGVVIGRLAKRVPVQAAMDHVAGYVVLNDVSARDWQGTPAALEPGQKGDGQWLRGKGSDTFLPMGPTFVTADEVDPKTGLRLRSWRITADGVEHPMQDGTTADLMNDVPGLVAFVSRAITLEPGDIISTGTPGGVGVFRDPPVFVQPGDRMRCEIEGIGSVENPLIDWTEVA
jgi:2-keto-4-pentenoate hydratase/2-oxohepta-3-ene-1,7-dioic acid hydratase in catechol pathway